MPACVRCGERDATAKCITCARCRAYMHRWGNEPSERVIEHANRLKLRRSLMESIAIVTDDRVKFVDQRELEAKHILFASKLRRRAKAIVVSIKTAEALKRREAAEILRRRA
jgi:hypothetical protein